MRAFKFVLLLFVVVIHTPAYLVYRFIMDDSVIRDLRRARLSSAKKMQVPGAPNAGRGSQPVEGVADSNIRKEIKFEGSQRRIVSIAHAAGQGA